MKCNAAKIFEEIPGFYKIIPLNVLRRTKGVTFDNVPLDALPRIDAIDRVIHASNATSPGPVGEVARPWYMHPHQDDNLVVLQGVRLVEIYVKEYGRIENFEVTPDQIVKNGKVIYAGPAMLVWPRGVFHRIESLAAGSSAINFAVHYEGMDLKSNFNIYDLDPETGAFRLIREGFRDQ
ncbi:MAG: hypothetical protein KJ950_14670 [Proteobacteria bacterium]|nr:hypothetical protein [Pseudomonadota bacterium]MBU1689012.1 hypothetical protein [Pseudomonadota bacterium]